MLKYDNDPAYRRFKLRLPFVILLILILLVSCGCSPLPDTSGDAGDAFISGYSSNYPAQEAAGQVKADTDKELADIEFEGEPYVEVNDNEPEFDEDLKTEESFEMYGKLDGKGRCTAALANLSEETEPDKGEERGDISSVHPTGWVSNQGWERCHLIGWQLSDENANEENLITGTHYLNVSGMLPFENMVSDYIDETGNHVLYEVVPIFDGSDMIASGVHMEAESVEDGGEGISFNIYCFNVTPGAEINYVTGAVETDEEVAAGSTGAKDGTFAKYSRDARKYVLNTNTMKFHYPSCSSVSDMAEYNKEYVTCKRSELIDKGYEPCGRCEP